MLTSGAVYFLEGRGEYDESACASVRYYFMKGVVQMQPAALMYAAGCILISTAAIL